MIESGPRVLQRGCQDRGLLGELPSFAVVEAAEFVVVQNDDEEVMGSVCTDRGDEISGVCEEVAVEDADMDAGIIAGGRWIAAKRTEVATIATKVATGAQSRRGGMK